MAAIILIILVILIYAPQWWVSYVMKKYARTIKELPGTGGELAQYLVERHKLSVTVETTELGDHYCPETKAVRLSPQYFNGKSLTAIAIAAHEVGHAVQDHLKEDILVARVKMVKVSQRLEKMGAGIIFIAPIISAITHSHYLGLLIGLIGLLGIASNFVVHLISLPVEFDASFNKALVLLEEGNYITKLDLNIVRKVLLAAALTYVAGALASLFNVWRWISILKR